MSRDSNIFFAHVRPRRFDSVTINTDECLPTGGATIAFYIDPTGQEPMYAAVAYCHPNDRYNKKIGRTKASGQLASLMLGGKNVADRTAYGAPRYFSAELSSKEDARESGKAFVQDAIDDVGWYAEQSIDDYHFYY